MKTFTPYLCFVIFALTFSSCEDLLKESNPEDELYVKFYNSPASAYTITSLELKARGESGSIDTKSAELDGKIEPTSTWGANILPQGLVIPPGKHLYFNLKLKNLHWVQYRIKVDDGNGNIVPLDFQGFQSAPNELAITNWGSDKRTVNVTIDYNNTEDRIWINGNGDWAGIDDDETTGTTALNF